MKRILISSCVLAMLLTMGRDAEATLERVSSCADLLAKQKPVQDASTADENNLAPDIFTVEEYQDLVNKFYDQNKEYLIGTPPDIREEATVSAVELYRLGKLLGFKEYKLKGAPEGSEGIPTIDLSWPNIRRVFEGKDVLIFEGKDKKSWCDRDKKLRDIIKAIDKFEGFSPKNFPLVQKQIESQINEIIKLCLEGNEKLFNLEALDETCSMRFKEHLKQMLENYTGFQRIMSLLAVSILNSTENHHFVPGFAKIGVVVADGDAYADKQIEIRKKTFDESNCNGIFHESTHAYHDMILGSFSAFDRESAYPILNSANADFVGLLFPMLTDKKMKLVIDDIAKLIVGICDIETIKSHIKDSDEIIDIFKKIIDDGLGSMVFSKKDLTIKEGAHFDLKNILTPEMLAKAIYVYAAVFTSHNIEDNFKKSKGRWKIDHIWLSHEEVLTMVGLMPMTNGDRTYLLEDRQHEEIQKIRFQEESKTHAQLRKHYRSHAGIYLEDIFNKIAWTIDDICNEYADANNYTKTKIRECVAEGVGKLFHQIFKEYDEYKLQSVNAGTEESINILTPKDFIKPEDFRFNSDNISSEYKEEFSERILKTIEENNKLNKLHIAILSGDANKVNFLLKTPTYLNAACETGETPLHFAALSEDINAVRVLLKQGASTNAKSKKEETPLHWAVMSNNAKIINALCGCGQTNPNECDKKGYTPLHWAALHGNVESIKHLCKCKRTNLDATNKLGHTPLHLAVLHKKSVAMDALLDAGADPNIKDSNDGFTPLHWAAWQENVESIKHLCKCKRTKPNECSEQGCTPLHMAILHEKTKSIKALLDGGADPDIKGCKDVKGCEWGITALYLAIIGNKDIGVIKALIDGKANPNIKSGKKNIAPLHLVARAKKIEKAKKIEIIKALLASPIITIETVRSCKSDDPEIKKMLDDKIKEMTAADGNV